MALVIAFCTIFLQEKGFTLLKYAVLVTYRTSFSFIKLNKQLEIKTQTLGYNFTSKVFLQFILPHFWKCVRQTVIVKSPLSPYLTLQNAKFHKVPWNLKFVIFLLKSQNKAIIKRTIYAEKNLQLYL